MIRIPREVTWWYWLMTVVLLGAAFAGWRTGVLLAIGLTVIQVAHFTGRTGSATSFPVQVRLAYLAVLIAGLWAPLAWMYDVLAAGTAARVLVGYCLMARIVSLLPWNRLDDISIGLLRRTFLRAAESRPCGGWVGEGRSALWPLRQS
jgi:hypothetical protein